MAKDMEREGDQSTSSASKRERERERGVRVPSTGINRSDLVALARACKRIDV